MESRRLRLESIVASLRKHHGAPPKSTVTEPFEIILVENVAYLVDDEQRFAAWKTFKKLIGTRPAAILKAGKSRVRAAIVDGGMFPDQRADKIIRAAEIASEEFDGDLAAVLKLAPKKARAALKKFPGIGDPGADKILMLTRTQPVVALESNGLRVLLRLGFGEESKNYSKSYKSVQEVIAGEIKPDYDWLIEAHQLLRQHGQTLCKRSMPECNLCPLAKGCAYVRSPRKRN